MSEYDEVSARIFEFNQMTHYLRTYINKNFESESKHQIVSDTINVLHHYGGQNIPSNYFDIKEHYNFLIKNEKKD